jgi:DNA gyrase/topoisomerase IV subunit A
LINPDKIDEWIREVEERPASASLIIRYIANRLSELTAREEELAAQNIELLSGRKVEEYENRIASLEYQLELLKRQLGGEVVLPAEAPTFRASQETVSMLVYNPMGQVLRMEVEPAQISSAKTIARITGDMPPGEMQPSVLATPSREELLFIFDSGRTAAHPATHLTPSSLENLDWQNTFLEEPRVREELAVIQPIAKMSLYEVCIQSSRRGFVKTMKTSFFTSHLAEGYIGSGVKLPADKTCGLTLAMKNDLFVMVSQEGHIFSMPAERLPSAIEEVIHLGITDHIVESFVVGKKSSILFVTQNGKAVHRDANWLEGANSFKSKGQGLLSKERLESGIRIVGAAPVDETDWGVFLQSDGTLTVHLLSDLLASGSVLAGKSTSSITSFSAFQMPEMVQ